MKQNQDHSEMTDHSAQTAVNFTCPVCHNKLARDKHAWRCNSCEKTFTDTDEGYANFLMAEGYADEDDIERGLHEEKTATVTMEGYLIPLLKKIFHDRAPHEVKVLDIGCGVAKSVDLLCAAGFDAWGADSGQRTRHWYRRENSQKLAIANGDALPFPDNTFDFIFCAGVIEHVGCIGDARSPSPGYEKKRYQFAQDTVRVTKKKGMLNFTCPNRLFPFDLFHRNDEMKPWRFHWPWDPFLFSTGDFHSLFVKQCDCTSLETVPIKGYWGFLRFNKTPLQRMGCRAVNLWFNTVCCWPGLRGSFANPWLSVLATK